ncbi:MAG: ATP-dependent zinc metalloprotease FtsH [Oscillospiraceae bacterium]|nr:ATP-dependent zinc metalloprotease FtsH [Oscillospiraceae bacterium]
MKLRKYLPTLIYLVVLYLAFSWVTGAFTPSSNAVPYSRVLELFRKEQVSNFTLRDDELTMELYNPYNGSTTVQTDIADPESFLAEIKPMLDEQTASGILASYDIIAEAEPTVYSLIPPLLIVGIIILILWAILMGRFNANNPMANFGRARTVLGIPDDQKVTFDDVAGADEEKAELQEVVDFLSDPEKFTAIGARIPHGMLLVGPPGTGKTLLARAVAGEAGVQFLSISGSDFVEMYVGVGASRVRDLFDQAKKMAPAIVFIDEIDAVGRKRGSGLGGGHDEKEQTLNQLLVEMDGFSKNEGVIVLAATNRPDILDPALLRPGRFDRQIHVGRPDVKGREEILKVHARGKKLDDSVSLKTLARATTGFTGADLSNLLNEAAIMAARQERPVISMTDLNEAMMKITAGPEKKSRVQTRKDLKEVAIHEAGHAIAMYRLPTQSDVRHITIIPRGTSLGATWHFPKDDSVNLTRNQMYEEIVALLGGRVAEALFVGDISVGASSDIDRATALARDMVARYGMCERLGTVSYLGGGEVFIGRDYQTTKSYSEAVAGTIDEEVKLLIDKAYAHCKEILEQNTGKLHEIVDYLLEHESMTGEQFTACMENREITAEVSSTSLFDGFEEISDTEEH